MKELVVQSILPFVVDATQMLHKTQNDVQFFVVGQQLQIKWS